jgi:hypothetical protein
MEALDFLEDALPFTDDLIGGVMDTRVFIEPFEEAIDIIFFTLDVCIEIDVGESIGLGDALPIVPTLVCSSKKHFCVVKTQSFYAMCNHA